MATATQEYNLASNPGFLARVLSVVLDAGASWVLAFDAVGPFTEEQVQKHNLVVQCRRNPQKAAAEVARCIVPEFTTWDGATDPDGGTITDAQIQSAIVAKAKVVASVRRKVDGTLEDVTAITGV